MEKTISYLNKTYGDYRKALIEYSKEYYPDLDINYDDASVGSWIIDLNASIADNLSYHIDRVYQETDITSAQERNSLYNIARSNGLKVPGPKGAMAEVQFTVKIPVGNNTPDWNYAPVIKKGTKVSSGNQNFELMEDVDFGKQFDGRGNSDRTIVPMKDSNNRIVYYKVSKLGIVVAGESKIYKQAVSAGDIKPFMEILIPMQNVMSVEGIIVKYGDALQSNPNLSEFYRTEDTCGEGTGRTFHYTEVDSLAQQEAWEDVVAGDVAETHTYGYNVGGTFIPVSTITKGEWKPLKYKYMTEYTDNGYMKVIFGAGIEAGQYPDITDAASFSKHRMTKILRNGSLGFLPPAGSTVFILYRVGGGKASNVAKGAINTISYLNYELPAGGKSYGNVVEASLTVSNTTPSISGRDMPTPEELRYYIKYNNGAQNRCITVKDYESRILSMPAKYGAPYRVGVAEDNNKVMVSVLGLDYKGNLDALLPALLIENIQKYLAHYRSINDYVEIKPGKIINLGIEVDLHVDRNYNETDVANNVKQTVKSYMDIEKHQMGDHIYVGDLIKEIVKIDGVVNLIDLRVYNKFGTGYSNNMTTQETVSQMGLRDDEETLEGNILRIDLKASDMVLYSDGDTMFEIKGYDDIKINMKEV